MDHFSDPGYERCVKTNDQKWPPPPPLSYGAGGGGDGDALVVLYCIVLTNKTLSNIKWLF